MSFSLEFSDFKSESLAAIVIDREGIICEANFNGEAFGHRFGWPVDDIVGSPYSELHEEQAIDSAEINRGVRLVCLGEAPQFRYRFDVCVDDYELCFELLAQVCPDDVNRVCVKYENIFDRNAKTRDLISNTNLYETLLTQAAVGILYQNSRGRIELANVEAERLLNASQSELRNLTEGSLPCNIFDESGVQLHFEDLPNAVALKTEKAQRDIVLRLAHGGAQEYWISCTSEAIFDNSGARKTGVLSSFVDITQERQATTALQEQTDRAQMAIESAEMGVWEWVSSKNDVVWDQKMYELYGFHTEAERKNVRAVDAWKNGIHPEDRAAVINLVKGLVNNKPRVSCDFRIIWPDGRLRHMRAQTRQIRGASGELLRLVGVTHDITHQVLAEKRLWELAYTDTLTGAYSRAGLNVRLSETLAQSLAGGSEFFIVSFGLRRFKEINENYGLSIGDKLLCEVSRRVHAAVGSGDTVARIGGDEFTIIIQSVPTKKDLDSFIQHLRHEILQPFHLNAGLVVNIDLAMGLSCFPSDGSDPAALQTNVGLAMRNDRLSEHSNYTAYSKEMSEVVARKFNLKYQLYSAVKDNEFQLYYQPIIDLQTKLVVGCEALIRWRDNSGNFISPVEFIPVVEESGLIYELGKWVNLTAVKQWKLWQELGPDMQYISVNVSPRQLEQPEFVDDLVSLVREHDISPENIQLEITEGTFLREYHNEDGMLHQLAFYGFRLAIDDFGTGYSSLAYLKRFNVDVIKIDRSFIKDIEKDTSDRDIVSAILAMNNKLGFKTLVEGIETLEQHEIVSDLGCDSAQGYYYGRPTFADEFAETYILLGSPSKQSL